jgi:hypothetical protein
MNLDEAQRKKVAAWVAEGLKLSEIQNRIASELGIRMTYMDVRLLVDDLKLTPKDADLPKAAATPLAATGATPPGGTRPARPGTPAKTKPPGPPTATAKVTVSVDQIGRPGAVVSGKVTFSDGNHADWYFDDAGRLGLAPQEPSYRPPAGDLREFQMILESELSKLGF